MASSLSLRIGQPSPLIFHLGVALVAYIQALLAAPRADSDSFPWADGLGERAVRLGPDLDQIEIACEIASRLRAMLEGLEIWQHHPYRRDIEDPPAIWSRGCTRLLDYGQTAEASDPEGIPVLVIPSLINRAYILDLAPGRSLLRWLAGSGCRPLLLDWGVPGAEEMGFGLEDYGRDRLVPAFDFAREFTGRPVAAFGYCMGGTLAVGLAARRPEGMSRLITIGAPWDFGCTEGLAGALRAMARANGGRDKALQCLQCHADAFGFVPVSVFQMLFALINPLQAALKFQRLARLNPDGAAAHFFVALEDWLSDGVPMPVRAAQDLLVGWQVDNRTAKGTWEFLGGQVRPEAIEVPAICFCGRTDTISPLQLAEALPRALPGGRLVRPHTGHVGMVVGSSARASVWRPLVEFLAS